MVQQYKKDIEKLFNEWENQEHHKGKIFIRDGVINPEVFYSSDFRPLFLLKEAYGKDESNNDIAKEHNINFGEDCKQKNSTWPNISRWIYAMLNTTKEKPAEYTELDCFTDKKNEYLQKMAVVNIKKSNGFSITIPKNLNFYVVKDRKKIKKQIELINPTIIVCGNTLSRFKKILSLDKKYNTQFKEKHFAWIEHSGNKILVLDCYHPSKRSSPRELYDIFAELYHKAISE